jgi:hypothetical protein
LSPWKPEDGDTKCQQCFAPNPLWFAPNEIWNQVIGKSGVLCPNCFLARAKIDGAWKLVPEDAEDLAQAQEVNRVRAALSQAQQALHSIAEMNCGCSTLAKQILGLPSDTQGAQAQENELCAACHHVKNDSTMHFDAKGTNWGAALHWFQVKEA